MSLGEDLVSINYSSKKRKFTLSILIVLTLGIGLFYQNCGNAPRTAASLGSGEDDFWSMFGLSDAKWEEELKKREDLKKIILNEIPDDSQTTKLCPFAKENELLYFNDRGATVPKATAANPDGSPKAGFTKEDPKTASRRQSSCFMTVEQWRYFCSKPALKETVICCGGNNDGSKDCGKMGIFDIEKMIDGIDRNFKSTSTDKATADRENECKNSGPRMGIEVLLNCFDRERKDAEAIARMVEKNPVCASVSNCQNITYDTEAPKAQPAQPAPPAATNPNDFYEVTAMHGQPFYFSGQFSCESRAAAFANSTVAIEAGKVVVGAGVSLVPYCAETTQPLDEVNPNTGTKFWKQKFLELRLRVLKSDPKKYKIGRLVGVGNNGFSACVSGAGLMYFGKPIYSDLLLGWLNYIPAKKPIPGAGGVARCEGISSGNEVQWYQVFQVTDADAP